MKTPICDFVREYAARSGARMHMPGHKGAGPLGVEALDITEIRGADELYRARGIIRESEDSAARLFGAADLNVLDASDIDAVSEKADFVFCAVDMKKDEIRALEEAYAKHEIPVVSNNSACRGLKDVPMVVPEINAAHLAVIPTQRKRLGTERGIRLYQFLREPLIRRFGKEWYDELCNTASELIRQGMLRGEG